jgi:hypothetical protein
MSKNIWCSFALVLVCFSAGAFALGAGATPLSAETYFRDPDVTEALLWAQQQKLATDKA